MYNFILLSLFYIAASILNIHLWDVLGVSTFYNIVGTWGGLAFLTLWYRLACDKIRHHEATK
jgi:hypothetical protein